jgi:tRNA dimethylallyltransferase
LNPAEPNSQLREKVKNYSVDELFDLLWELDPERAQKLNDSDLFNPRRLVRAIEIATAANDKTQMTNKQIDYEMYYPEYDREQLYAKIDKRVETMFEAGLVGEVKNLIKLGYKDTKPMQGIGYKEVLLYLNNEINYNDCVEKIKQDHRNYVARQITWFEGEGRGYDLTKINFQNS